MFEIERRSNLGPLVMAVVVGLLALASPHYRRLDMQAIEELLTFESAAEPEALPATETLEVMGPPPATDLLRARLAEIDQKFSIRYKQWKKGQVPKTDAELKTGIAEVRSFAAQLEKIAGSYADDEQMAVLRLLFMAADIRSGPYSDAFLALCEHLESNENEQLASQAGVLRFYHFYDLTRPNAAELLPALDDFSSRHHDPKCTIRLYSMVSHSLWSRGRLSSAEEVLQLGIQRMAGQPGVGRLVNQMVDQRTAPQFGNIKKR